MVAGNFDVPHPFLHPMSTGKTKLKAIRIHRLPIPSQPEGFSRRVGHTFFVPEKMDTIAIGVRECK